jgi:hypothetical protein
MSSIGSPTAASSPKCKQRNPVNPDLSMLRTLIINFQSIKNKVPDLHALIDSAQPHVIKFILILTNSVLLPVKTIELVSV